MGLWYAFHDFQFDTLLGYIHETDIKYILFSVILMLGSIVIRAYRWKLILLPIGQFSLKHLFSSTMIGYFGNGILPFRLGELLRAYALSKKDPINASAVFGSIVLERLLDLLSLTALMIFLAFFSPLMAWNRGIFIGFILLTTFGFFIVLWIGKSHSAIHDHIIQWQIFKSSSAQKILIQIQNVLNGLISIRKSKHVLELILLSLVLWIIYYYGVQLVLTAMDIQLDWVAAGIILIATTLAIAIPSSPGYVGTYHAAAVYVMVNIYNVNMSLSQAFAVLIHAVGFIPTVVIGFYYFLESSIHLNAINKEKIVG